MRRAKTTAILLAVSVLLAGCGGNTGSTASGAGVTASGQEQTSGQQDAGQQTEAENRTGTGILTPKPRFLKKTTRTGRSRASMPWRPTWPRILSALCIPETISQTFTTTSRGSPRQTSSPPNLTSEFEAPSHLSGARRPGRAAGASVQWPPARQAF